MSLRTAKQRAKVLRVDQGSASLRMDTLIGEEPLSIGCQGPSGKREVITTTLRTPGDDFALATGLVITEGFFSPNEISGAKYCVPREQQQEYNAVTLLVLRELGETVPTLRTSSCGWCGTVDLEDRSKVQKASAGEMVFKASEIHHLAKELTRRQRGLSDTGAAHAALICLRDGGMFIGEDVGRHNALDKAVGKAFAAGSDTADSVVVLSGRAGVDLVAKSARAGAALIAAVSAPTSLAVKYATEAGICLVGFLREERFNVYSRFDAIDLEA